MGFPCGSAGKESACNAGDLGLIPGLGRSPGEGNGNPLQYSCLGNPMDRGAWQPTVPRITKESNMTKQLIYTIGNTFPMTSCWEAMKTSNHHPTIPLRLPF